MTLNKADYSLSRGLASSNQVKALGGNTEVPRGREPCASRLPSDWSYKATSVLGPRPALRILGLPASIIAQACSFNRTLSIHYPSFRFCFSGGQNTRGRITEVIIESAHRKFDSEGLPAPPKVKERAEQYMPSPSFQTITCKSPSHQLKCRRQSGAIRSDALVELTPCGRKHQ